MKSLFTKSSATSVLMTVGLMIITATSALGQCCTYASFYFGHSWIVQNGYTMQYNCNPEAVPASGACAVSVVDLTQLNNTLTGLCTIDTGPNGLASDTDGDSSDLATEGISARALVPFNSPWLHNLLAMGAAEFDCLAWIGSTRMDGHSAASIADRYQDCDPRGFDILAGLAGTASAYEIEWNFEDPCEVTFLPWFDADLEYSNGICDQPPCCEFNPPNSASGSETFTHFGSYVVTVEFDDHSVAEYVTNGVYSATPQAVTRLGFFEDEAFDRVQWTPCFSGVYSDEFGLNAPPANSSILRLTFKTFTESFTESDGNLNPLEDSLTCWTDRVQLYSRLGTGINDASYLARADLDLDGDIDVSDLLLFNQLPCNADMNCDGELDIFDFTAYQNEFDAATPAADINGDGDLDTFDFIDFQNAYGVGC